MSVAMLWILIIGGEQEIASDDSLIGARLDSSQHTPASTPTLSCFVNGLLTILAQLLNGQSRAFGRLFPFPFKHFSNLTFANSS